MTVALLGTAQSDFAEKLPVSLTVYSDSSTIRITNDGECPIYKLHVSTVPPKAGLLTRMFGVSFQATIGTLKTGYHIDVPTRSLINSDGKKLDDDYTIGEWVLQGSYCGDDLKKTFE